MIDILIFKVSLFYNRDRFQAQISRFKPSSMCKGLIKLLLAMHIFYAHPFSNAMKV